MQTTKIPFDSMNQTRIFVLVCTILFEIKREERRSAPAACGRGLDTEAPRWWGSLLSSVRVIQQNKQKNGAV